MKVIFFCENANQVHLSFSIANSDAFLKSTKIEINLLDWDNETAAWVIGTVSDVGWHVPVTNMMSKVPTLRSVFQKSKQKPKVLRDIAYESLQNEPDGTVLVQYNDASVRGSAIAHVCRNVGIRRLLVQDGFLNFRSKTANLQESDQNYFWGSSQPELLAVWGQKMKDALIERHNLNPKSISVSGPAKPGFEVPPNISSQHRDRLPRVLWADQAILDQRKAGEKRWLKEFSEIAQELSQFETDLRFHPSTREETRLKLEEAVGDNVTVSPPKNLRLSAEYIQSYDVVVTYYSTVFLDCLINNIPCVLYRTRSVDIELPTIEHPLLAYCTSIENLREVVLKVSQQDVVQAAPLDIFDYIISSNGADSIAKLLSAEPPLEDKKESDTHRPSIDIVNNVQRLEGKKILVLSTSFGDHIGVGKPINIFMEYAAQFNLDIETQLVNGGDPEYLIANIARSNVLIINGLGVIATLPPETLPQIVSLAETLNIAIVFYCHETHFVYNKLHRDIGGKIDFFRNHILPISHSLTVSDQQADWLARLGAQSVRTVYNSIGPNFRPLMRVEEQQPMILMVGTQQKRKGVDLFSRTADLAREQGLGWRFVWLGAYTKAADGCYKSSAVEWVGHVNQTELRDWLSRASVFFLSSVDDPMPLSVGEALASGVPSVVYAQTGFGPFIQYSGSGGVFSFYDTHAAIDVLKSSVGMEMPNVHDAVMDMIGVEAFGKRMIVALGEISIVANPDFHSAKNMSPLVALHALKKGKKKRLTSVHRWKRGVRLLFSDPRRFLSLLVSKTKKLVTKSK